MAKDIDQFMAKGIDQCVELSHLSNKTTIVIPTSQAPIRCLMLNVFSLLLRSKPGGFLEHFCVCVNGPDERTGDTKDQDVKQSFLEDLRDMEWFVEGSERLPMPLTIIRVWSRQGIAESMSMALPWIHTNYYTITQDDAFIINSNWEKEVSDKLCGRDVAIVHTGKLLDCGLDHHIHKGMYLLRFPQMSMQFVTCKKKWLMKSGVTWKAFHMPRSDDQVIFFDLDELPKEFLRYYKELGLMDEELQDLESYNFLRQEIGAWVFQKLVQQGYKFVELDSEIICHLDGMSFRKTEAERQETYEKNSEAIQCLEKEIENHPEYGILYKKYLKADL